MSFNFSLFLGADHLPVGEPFTFSDGSNWIGLEFPSFQRSVWRLYRIFWQNLAIGIPQYIDTIFHQIGGIFTLTCSVEKSIPQFPFPGWAILIFACFTCCCHCFRCSPFADSFPGQSKHHRGSISMDFKNVWRRQKSPFQSWPGAVFVKIVWLQDNNAPWNWFFILYLDFIPIGVSAKPAENAIRSCPSLRIGRQSRCMT
jgi:hypothetical protein